MVGLAHSMVLIPWIKSLGASIQRAHVEKNVLTWRDFKENTLNSKKS
jgi:hypothetical protein